MYYKTKTGWNHWGPDNISELEALAECSFSPGDIVTCGSDEVEVIAHDRDTVWTRGFGLINACRLEYTVRLADGKQTTLSTAKAKLSPIMEGDYVKAPSDGRGPVITIKGEDYWVALSTGRAYKFKKEELEKL